MMTRRVFFGLAGAAALTSRTRAQASAFTFDAEGAGRTLRDPQGRIVLGYLTSKPADVPLAGNSACCVHPFNTLAGQRATDIAPADHRDHRGIFFAWHDMTFTKGGATQKADFWGWGRFAPVEDRVIVNRDLRLVRSDATSAEIAVTNDWRIGTEAVLTEAAAMRVGESQGARVLDLTYTFTSGYEVTLNQMAFTGFCFRCRKDGAYVLSDANGEVTLPDSNATDATKNWPARDWYSHTLTLPDGTVIASAVIDHPSNPTSTWHEPRGVSFLNPCVSALAPVTIAAGTPFVLRYRAVAHDGPFPAGLLDRMAAEWRQR
ncbi:MAG: PmoA family protein [Acidobacteria bacterium]|nr:PmoA family protein [Acidobacteriota bacterium]